MKEPADVLRSIVQFGTREADRVQLQTVADEAIRVAAALDSDNFGISPFLADRLAKLDSLAVTAACFAAVSDGVAVLHRRGGSAYATSVLAQAAETASALSGDLRRLPAAVSDDLSVIAKIDSLTLTAYHLAENLLLPAGPHDSTASALSWTAAAGAAWAITAVSTYQACSGGDRVGCGAGAVSLATGGAGSTLSKVGKVAKEAGKARMASKARHLIRRNVTGPALRSAGRSLSRAGSRLKYTSLATSAGSLSYGYTRRYR